MKKLYFVLLIFSILLVGCSGGASEQIEPMTGKYEGKGISFTLTADGVITDLKLDGVLGESKIVECDTMHFPEDDLNDKNIFYIKNIYSGNDEDIRSLVTGEFSSNTTIEGFYFLGWCLTDEMVSFELEPYDGMHNTDWEASWVSD